MEGSQLFVCSNLGAVAHPFLCINTFTQGSLQILHQLHHTFFGSSREVFFHIHLAYQLTQHAVH